MSTSLFFELMSGSTKLATLSAREMGSLSERFEIPQWAWEVRVSKGGPAQRGTLIIPPDTRELQIVSLVLEAYFSDFHPEVPL